VQCRPGTFAVVGAEECTPCPLNTFQSLFASTECVECPLNRNTLNGRRSITLSIGSQRSIDCVCQRNDPEAASLLDERGRGFYGPYGESCYPCPGPEVADPEGLTEWVKCYEDGLVVPVSKAGFYVDTKALPVIVRQCVPPEACPEHYNVSGMEAEPCSPGYTGHGCSKCANGFSRYFGKCVECANVPKALNFLGTFVLYPLFFVVLTYGLSSSLKGYPEVSIVMNYMQVLGMFARYKVTWPKTMGRILRGMTFTLASPELMQPSCAISSWEYKDSWFLMMSTPLIFMGFVVISTVIIFGHREFTRRCGDYMRERYPQFFQKRKKGATWWEKQVHKWKRLIGFLMTKAMDHDESVQMLRRQIHATITFSNLAYAFLVLKFFEVIECSKNISDGNEYLVAEPNYQCYEFAYDKPWGKMFPVEVAAGIFYVVGFPMLVMYVIFSIRNNKTNSSQFSIFGSLYVRYDHAWYFWEVQVLIMKFLLAASLYIFKTFSRANILKQTLYAQAILITSVFTHSYAGPYDNWVLNSYQTLCGFCQFMIIFSGQAFSGKLSDTLHDKLDSYMPVIALLPVAIFVTGKINMVYEAYKNMRGVKEQSLREQQGLSLFETLRAEKGGFSVKTTEARREYFDSYLKVHDSEQLLFSKEAVRAAKDLWWQQRIQRHSDGIPTKEELKPVFDSFYSELEQVALEHLSGEKEEVEFYEFLHAQHMMIQILAQNNVEENRFFRNTLQAVLDYEPERGPVRYFKECVLSVLIQFNADRPRHGSTYTNFIARFEQYKAKESKAEEERVLRAFRSSLKDSHASFSKGAASPSSVGSPRSPGASSVDGVDSVQFNEAIKEQKLSKKADLFLTPARERINQEARRLYHQRLVELSGSRPETAATDGTADMSEYTDYADGDLITNTNRA